MPSIPENKRKSSKKRSFSVLDPNTFSEEESVPEDSDWSSDVSTSSEPEAEQTSPQPIMMNQPPTEPMMSEVQDETSEVTQQPRQPAQTSKTTSNGKVQLITLDDIPPSQWRDRFQEFKAFLFLQVQKPQSQPREILLDFASRFTGILYD
ncbi:hypothetical protein TIFTF001_029145 [Ficus carica]|uniref:Uncharacterized protein n=1 Tax=Ficus carica TaxID=3494 RepID=A0AA88DRA5_FICCA|nr:hypothetical protein TIFTF001_029145 [Ficus carica]